MDIFWSESIGPFWCKGIGKLWTQKIIQEKSTIFTKILNYTKSSSIIFYTKLKLCRKYNFTYYLHTAQITSLD